jgi:flagellar biosynthesis chaperone FliJ
MYDTHMQTLELYIAELQNIVMNLREQADTTNGIITRLEQRVQQLDKMSENDNLIAVQFEKAMARANPSITPLPIEE